MTRMRIRVAHAGEAEALSELALRSKGYWGYSEGFLQACRAELAVSEERIRSGRVFVATAPDGTITGFCSLEPRGGPRVELGHLFVEPEAIGRGYGRRLLAHAAGVARGLGFRVLEIQGDPHASAFYASCGAQRVGTTPSASVPGRELPLFELSLQVRGQPDSRL